MNSVKCKHCGADEIDTDHARGDAVCTSCGSVLERTIIVSTTQFQEGAGGAVSVVGQFVPSDSQGAPRLGSTFHTGFPVDSRQLTLAKAKKKITELAQILRLNQTCVDIAFNFFKMSLNRELTRGRRSEHVIGACVYLTCRVEGTPHMLIDLCDALDITEVYTLGRTFLRLASELCIRVPTPDPCLYVMRFAGALKFGKMTHTVAMTALRLISRMKRDNIHTGRHASGLCGAALLLAARIHEFSRSTADIVSVVKVHQSTLRKRLMEFGETPSSQLSIDEFMSVDLEEEQDPPSFRITRKKDRGVAKIPTSEELDERIFRLQREIECELKKTKKKRPRLFAAAVDGIDTIELEATVQAVSSALVGDPHQGGIPPTYEALRLDRNQSYDEQFNESSDDLDDLDDDELEAYILSPEESTRKHDAWMALNADFLQKKNEKDESRKAKEAAKPVKKRIRVARKSDHRQPVAGSASEAIEKVLKEKKLSNKINYEVLKNLTLPEVKTKNARKLVIPQEKNAEKGKDILEEEDVEEEAEGVVDTRGESAQISIQQLLNEHRNSDDDDYGQFIDYDDD